MITRRRFVVSGALAGGSVLLGAAEKRNTAAVDTSPGTRGQPSPGSAKDAALPPAEPGKPYTPVVTPDIATLPWKVLNGVKVYHLIAEPIARELAPGLVVNCWGYNGHAPGPTLEAVEGDRVRIYVTNKLPEPTTVHWHGVVVPNGMDGIAGLNQRPIQPGETFKYEFTFRYPGTFMYHPHYDEMTQMGMGLTGMIVVHPRTPQARRPDQDFALMLHEWFVKPGTSRPDTSVMTEFNLFTMNGKAFPGTSPLVAKLGDLVRIRIGNLSAMDHHPIHLHGYSFRIVETDGGQIPESAQWRETTVLVPTGSARAIEFVADAPGDWALHCHMLHHVMNQMGHGIPNMVGVKAGDLDEKIRPLLPMYMTMGNNGMGGMGKMGMPVPKNTIPMVGKEGPFGYIDMGGMMTILKVREDITSYEDPGWFQHPTGTVALPAAAQELRADQVIVEMESPNGVE